MHRLELAKIALLSLIVSVSQLAVSAELFRSVIHNGRDPFTLPQVKEGGCSNWAYPWPGAKICVAPTSQCNYMYSELAVVVEGPDGEEAKNEVNRCFSEAAVSGAAAGLITGYATGGAAGLSAAAATFKSSLESCVKGTVKESITTKTVNPSHWGGWGSC
ncbi:hypothetical protein [Pseudomonas entomophila]|nr:hypothetical protein [Pseudomonas entomophila]WMW06960.1 hypothetical protein RAH46_06395 [Pseudomonas entomophila]